MGRPVKESVSEATIGSYLRGLRAVFRWAVKQGYLRSMPEIPKVLGHKHSNRARMKGRPISPNEFVRILRTVSTVVGQPAARSWRRLLIGLWWSGLRLGEALNLYWEMPLGDSEAIAIDANGEYPVFIIQGTAQKSGRDQLCPMAPEFWEFLQKRWAQAKRHGRVFELTSKYGNEVRNLNEVSKTISAIGEAARVVVDQTKGKYASAHDLRRSFGLRWARRVLPQDLKELMRHADITTTMTYYVGSLAQETSAGIWRTYREEKRVSLGQNGLAPESTRDTGKDTANSPTPPKRD